MLKCLQVFVHLSQVAHYLCLRHLPELLYLGHWRDQGPEAYVHVCFFLRLRGQLCRQLIHPRACLGSVLLEPLFLDAELFHGRLALCTLGGESRHFLCRSLHSIRSLPVLAFQTRAGLCGGLGPLQCAVLRPPRGFGLELVQTLPQARFDLCLVLLESRTARTASSPRGLIARGQFLQLVRELLERLRIGPRQPPQRRRGHFRPLRLHGGLVLGEQDFHAVLPFLQVGDFPVALHTSRLETLDLFGEPLHFGARPLPLIVFRPPLSMEGVLLPRRPLDLLLDLR
mmetsp:Transcript_33538/g.92621  ORF Transcript_33538/g.92621 Transcript_33538/m.92621 type:complete len:284 (-) Transcript_33538:2165-3016(-)